MTLVADDFLPCVEMEPDRPIAGSIVWLHGLGASGHDFEDVVPLLERPDVRFVFPHAPRHAVTVNGGLLMPAWYDILRFGAPTGGENESHVRESARLVANLIEREVSRGTPPSRIVVAGFSQGGAMALHVGTRYPKTLGGILVLSGYEVLSASREAEESPANRRTPLLACHGTQDPLVEVAWGRSAYEAFAHEGRPAAWHEFPMGHQMSMAEIGVIRDWLAARFAPAAADE